MVPLLLRPKILSIKNSLALKRLRRQGMHREIIFLLASIGLLILVYHASYTSFTSVQEKKVFSNEILVQAIAILMSLLTTMVSISAAVGTISTLYLSHDLEFLSSSPISTSTLLIGKGSEILFQSSWMMLVFSVPLLAGIGVALNAPATFYILCGAIFIPLLVTPVAWAISIVALLMRFIPARALREVFLLLAVSFVLFMYVSARHSLFDSLDANLSNPAAMKNLLGVLQGMVITKPSFLSSNLLGAAITGKLALSGLALPMLHLYGLCLISIIVALTILYYLYPRSLSEIRTNNLLSSSVKNQHYELFSSLFSFIPAPARALWLKEMKQFARDLSQGVQLIMLLGICLVYLYNFKVMNRVSNLSDEMLEWWRGALLVCNIAMGSFIISAICSRFVFPTMSLDGNSFWVLKKSPISIDKIARTKFLIWYPPICIVTSIILISGALALDTPPIQMSIVLGFSFCISYGLVGSAVGLGCYFVRFDWEHPSQVTSGFGNFIYMIVGTVLVFLNSLLALAGIIVFIMGDTRVFESRSTVWLTLAILMLAVAGLNRRTMNWCISSGSEALQKKL